MSSEIKKRRFYNVQPIGRKWDNTNVLVTSYEIYSRTRSRAEVTYNGTRHRFLFNMEVGRNDPSFCGARDYGRRLLVQETTRHIAGPTIKDGYFDEGWIILSRHDLISVLFDARKVNEHDLFEWCRDNLVNWHEIITEHQGGKAIYAVFENENDAVHTRLRWA